jgi:hypothetical protein
MAGALSLGAIVLGVTDRLRRRGVGPEMLLGLVAAVFISAQLALILRLPLPSFFLWAVVAAAGAATVLSFAILTEYFPKELAGRANGALNLFHIAAAFFVQYATGIVLAQWTPQAGHYPAIAYQTAFAINLVLQVAAWIWFVLPLCLSRSLPMRAHNRPHRRVVPWTLSGPGCGSSHPPLGRVLKYWIQRVAIALSTMHGQLAENFRNLPQRLRAHRVAIGVSGTRKTSVISSSSLSIEMSSGLRLEDGDLASQPCF